MAQLVKFIGEALAGRLIDQDQQFQISMGSLQWNPVRHGETLLSLQDSDIFFVADFRYFLAMPGPDCNNDAHRYGLGRRLLPGPGA